MAALVAPALRWRGGSFCLFTRSTDIGGWVPGGVGGKGRGGRLNPRDPLFRHHEPSLSESPLRARQVLAQGQAVKGILARKKEAGS